MIPLNGRDRHDIRTGSGSGEIGLLRARRTRADFSPVAASFYVENPEAIECDFWLWSIRIEADNADFFYGPVEPPR